MLYNILINLINARRNFNEEFETLKVLVSGNENISVYGKYDYLNNFLSKSLKGFKYVHGDEKKKILSKEPCSKCQELECSICLQEFK